MEVSEFFKSYHCEAFFLNHIIPADWVDINPCRHIYYIALTKFRTHEWRVRREEARGTSNPLFSTAEACLTSVVIVCIKHKFSWFANIQRCLFCASLIWIPSLPPRPLLTPPVMNASLYLERQRKPLFRVH